MNKLTGNQKIAIKICGVTDPEIAALTARAGANYIGIVFHATSARYVTVSRAHEIAQACHENGATAVAVFTQHNATIMQEICEQMQINAIQLHGARARAEHIHLPDHIERIYVRQLLRDGSMANALTQGLKQCNANRDIILFDNINPGSGESIQWHLFKYRGDFPFGIAGGLNNDNVADVILRVKPRMVDVSSGVEDTPGQKNFGLIEEFIQQVRFVEREIDYDE